MRDIIYWNGIRKVVIEEDRWGEEWRQRKKKEERIHPRPFLSFDFQLFHRRYLYSRITPHRILANTLHVFFTTSFSLPTFPHPLREFNMRATQARNAIKLSRSRERTAWILERRRWIHPAGWKGGSCSTRNSPRDRKQAERRVLHKRSTIEREKMEFVSNLFNCKLNSRLTPKRI